MATTALDPKAIPRHVAIIMDGNGRWATQQGRIRTFGHRQGSESVRRIVRASRRLGLDALRSSLQPVLGAGALTAASLPGWVEGASSSQSKAPWGGPAPWHWA